ncbi:glutamine--fructose-6-phosphate transaminase (isomerizing) [Candidatus Woesearchaeota archaeon]|jgi:glutamine---fructose-6-phosphate transaminase (isomerizing)|nr:glutamine--fructose-6-phosphate transaminase (isomerizing) [Candidatus Woesearchaeota archaeon]MBT5397163.1 glutamine--fructose-6-phosphate transaminase (isomerizing) [Candidatus Woesearchaeota archaeon]MBT5924853.1 glutamine--fructose-6-phosphate transaminase (isomerizing) [Candidatus Woesearchaeota archaeon]MBT6367291.1 glutamine--fructose-6-phosphate transaminase (isomerizing) [Candidatus Woesearchaeota archaeon]MBT7762563.1 glutamine--fructose-6-phosphate transaminase (isomerizing) [Cand
MCGIIGYVGAKSANDILIAGLERLEYRGYDSAGIAVTHDNLISINKSEGRVHNLKTKKLDGTRGIGHTRWATHGSPSDRNAHPFTCNENKFVVVHNGIIENYLELRSGLIHAGISCTSDTDSEVIVHLISQAYNGNLKDAVCKVIKHLQGSYALCVMHKDTHELIGARNGSPLLIGLGNEENFLASDASAIIDHTKDVIYMNDFQVAEISKDYVKVFDFDGIEQQHEIKKIDWNLEQAQKGGYTHFMLKEIFEQPAVAQESLNVNFILAKDFSRIIIVACGTASYAGLVGKYVLEKVAKIPVVNEIASEFRYKECLISERDLVIAISQSGETADTLAAVRLAHQKGARTLGLINVVDSTIAREVDSVVYTRAGPEIGVASTKAFISQLITLYKLAFHFTDNEMNHSIVDKIAETLQLSDSIRKLAEQYYECQNFLYIGRNLSFPLALEGALKLKEISYIHAEAYPAGELKHGPIALVCTEMPTIAICPQDTVYEKTYSNIEEVKARKGRVITIATEGDERIKNVSNNVIYVPKVNNILYPFVIAVVLQLFAYHVADLRDCDVDKPRNLAKSVTVE